MPAVSTSDSPGANARTLAELMAEGNIPVRDALRYALLVAGALRRLHDEGRAHGAISCADTIIRDGAAELLPAEVFWGRVTPYTAPELLAGQAPDARSDIFSFGAMFYELLTGRRAFAGDTPAALAGALQQSDPARTGSGILDRFVRHCVAKDPAARWRIGKVQLELKLMAGAVRRAAARGSSPASATLDEAALQARIAKVTEQTVAQVAALERAVAPAVVLLGRLGRGLETVIERIAEIENSARATAERVDRMEQSAESGRQEIENFKKTLSSQVAAVEAARTAIAETDELVARVLKALEQLQSLVMERPAEAEPAVLN